MKKKTDSIFQTSGTETKLTEQELQEALNKFAELETDKPKALLLIPQCGEFAIHKIDVDVARWCLFMSHQANATKIKRGEN